MSEEKKKFIQIELTDEQKKQILEATGIDAEGVEFDAETLEDRIAPGSGAWFRV